MRPGFEKVLEALVVGVVDVFNRPEVDVFIGEVFMKFIADSLEQVGFAGAVISANDEGVENHLLLADDFAGRCQRKIVLFVDQKGLESELPAIGQVDAFGERVARPAVGLRASLRSVVITDLKAVAEKDV